MFIESSGRQFEQLIETHRAECLSAWEVLMEHYLASTLTDIPPPRSESEFDVLNTYAVITLPDSDVCTRPAVGPLTLPLESTKAIDSVAPTPPTIPLSSVHDAG